MLNCLFKIYKEKKVRLGVMGREVGEESVEGERGNLVVEERGRV